MQEKKFQGFPITLNNKELCIDSTQIQKKQIKNKTIYINCIWHTHLKNLISYNGNSP